MHVLLYINYKRLEWAKTTFLTLGGRPLRVETFGGPQEPNITNHGTY